MRPLGIILLVLGLAGFLFASSRRGSYNSVEGALKTAFSQEERGKRDLWDNARWLFVGAGVVGIVLIVLPGKKS